MLGWLFWAALTAGAVAAVIVISGLINKARLKDELRKKDVDDFLIETINRCDNVVKVKDLDSNNIYEIRGDDLSYDIYEGQRIIV